MEEPSEETGSRDRGVLFLLSPWEAANSLWTPYLLLTFEPSLGSTSPSLHTGVPEACLVLHVPRAMPLQWCLDPEVSRLRLRRPWG